MRACSVLLLAILLLGCATAPLVVPESEPVPFQPVVEFIDLPENTHDVEAMEQKYIEIIESLQKENHLLRVEIDYLKKKQKLIEKAYKLQKAYKKIQKEIEG